MEQPTELSLTQHVLVRRTWVRAILVLPLTAVRRRFTLFETNTKALFNEFAFFSLLEIH